MKSNKIAIVDGNALSLLGMTTLLQRIAPQVEVCAYSSLERLKAADAGPYVHYFVSGASLLEDVAYYRERRHQVMVMVAGVATIPEAGDLHIINTNCDEDTLVRNLLNLMMVAHQHGHNLPTHTQWNDPGGLSPREVEVLRLIASGLINKEIADRLCISLTTVISHRKSIIEKLGIHSVSGLTIYAVMNGYVEL